MLKSCVKLSIILLSITLVAACDSNNSDDKNTKDQSVQTERHSEKRQAILNKYPKLATRKYENGWDPIMKGDVVYFLRMPVDVNFKPQMADNPYVMFRCSTRNSNPDQHSSNRLDKDLKVCAAIAKKDFSDIDKNKEFFITNELTCGVLKVKIKDCCKRDNYKTGLYPNISLESNTCNPKAKYASISPRTFKLNYCTSDVPCEFVLRQSLTEELTEGTEK